MHSNEMDDIDVVLRHEQREVRLRGTTAERFYLTITNRSGRARHLAFWVEGVPGLDWALLAGDTWLRTVPLAAHQEIQLQLIVRCTPAAPVAGPAELTVRVGSADGQAWRASNAVQVIVTPAPVLHAELTEPGERHYRARHEMVLTLANHGNTELRGRLRTFSVYDRSGRPWLRSGAVHLAGAESFVLGPCDPPLTRGVRIDLPKPGILDRAWKVPLLVDVARDDMPPGRSHFELRQPGVLTGFADWCNVRETRRRRTLAWWAVIPLVIGIGLGTMFSGPPSGSKSLQAGAMSSQDSPVEYSDMPCDPGSSVLVLHSLEDSVSPADVKLLVDYETIWVKLRATETPALAGHVAQVSTRDNVCQAVTPDTTDPKFTRFVWIGAFPANDAPALCEALFKVPWKNCIPAQVVR